MNSIILVLPIFILSAVVTGVTGFGFAVLSTVILTAFFDPSVAVSLVLPSFVAVNISLLTNLNYSEFKSCGTRFYPYILAILVTSVVGMVAIDQIPKQPLRVFLGFLTLLFVAFQFDVLSSDLNKRIENKCFVESGRWMIVVGGLSGMVFGVTNIGVQMVAYLKSCSLSKEIFAGVIGMTFVGINLVRFGIAVATGLYPSTELITMSLGLSVPSFIGAFLGKRIQRRISDKIVSWLVYGLLTVVGFYLILVGVQIL